MMISYSFSIRRRSSAVFAFGLRLFVRIAVVALKAALKFGAAAFDNIKIVIAKLVPLSLHRTAELLPLSFNLIPIPGQSPFIKFLGAATV
jgi:hypothetical protein